MSTIQTVNNGDTLSDVRSKINNNNTNLNNDKLESTFITSASAVMPLDADEFGFYKIVGTAIKKVTWSNIKTTLKTYFDGLYATILQLGLKQTVFTGICQEQYLTENDIVIDGISATPTLTIATVKNGTAISAGNPICFYTDGSGVSVKHEITTPISVNFAYTTGVWYFYFDSTGTLIATQTPWNSFDTIATVYRLYVNSTLTGQDRIQVESIEYHINDISWSDHSWKHSNGTIWQRGLDLANNALSSGSPNADGRNTVVALSSGTCMDDNLPYTITYATGGVVKFTQDLGNTTPASLNATNSAIFNVRGNDSSGRLVKQVGTRFPFSWNASTNAPEYITTLGARTTVTNGYFFVYYIYSLQDPRRGETLKVVSAQTDFANTTLAAAHNWETLQALYPTLADNEIRPLYKLIYEYKTIYNVGCKYSALRSYDDIRKQKTTTTSVASGSLPASSITETFYANVQTAITTIRTTFAPLVSPSFTTPALGTPSSGTLTNCTFPTLNQNTSGTAANLSGTPALPNGTTTTTQSGNDNSTKLASTAYVDSTASMLTNKRINTRVVSATSYTTDTGTSLDIATCDEFIVTAQAGALKFNNPSGTPTEGQVLIIRIKDNGTARALTYDTQFRASSDLPLPTTTILSKTLYMQFIYNATDTKWDLLGLLNNF